ncbi:MAG: hypothetical protein OEZ10_13220 [Gammaproteobacteria bacterium]|nr:hypothetical protein [Gammaproteobacteria bacterium]
MNTRNIFKLFSGILLGPSLFVDTASASRRENTKPAVISLLSWKT